MSHAKKLLEIFRPGTFISAEGATLTFSASDVAATVAAYDVKKHRAPLVVGHPKMDDPSFGHAVALSLSSSNVVLAEPINVDPEFADAVNNERYDSISASFWAPNNPRNPVPGVYYLRHIGFLGAVPPAVTGLKQPSFADADDADLITINFADSQQEPVMTPEEKAALAAQQQKLKDDQASFANQQSEQQKQATALAAREKALAAKEAKAREDEINSFAEGLIKSGKLLPVEKTGMVALLGALPADQEVSFADGDGKTVSQVSADVLRGFLSNLPPRVDFAEHSAREGDAEQTTSFASPSGFAVDPTRLEQHNKITAHAAKHNITYAAAAVAVGG